MIGKVSFMVFLINQYLFFIPFVPSSVQQKVFFSKVNEIITVDKGSIRNLITVATNTRHFNKGNRCGLVATKLIF